LFQLDGAMPGTKPEVAGCLLTPRGSTMFGDKIGLVLFLWIVGAPLAAALASRMMERR
jgi:hypothetical protein